MKPNYKHGDANKTPEYKTWKEARQRCRNNNNTRFNHYGGRGIKFCKCIEEYSDFIKAVGRRPSPKHSIDRIDNNGNYCKKNIKWSTQEEQVNNRRPLPNKFNLPGVNKNRNGYMTRIYHKGKSIYLGYFECPYKAHQAYCKKYEQLHEKKYPHANEGIS